MYYTYYDMYYTQEEKELLKLIVKKYNCGFTNAFQYLPEDIKEIIHRRLRDEIIYQYIMNKKYFPYKSDRPDKKYFIITNDNKKIYFGQASSSDFTLHKDEARKQRYINRHKKNENWNNKDTAGFWS